MPTGSSSGSARGLRQRSRASCCANGASASAPAVTSASLCIVQNASSRAANASSCTKFCVCMKLRGTSGV
jgi:hypothetical protein